MAGKEPTQGMDQGKAQGGHDNDNRSGFNGLMPEDTRGAGGGGPVGPKGAGEGKEFRGGQSEAAYHGPGQLGEEDTSDGDTPNSPSRES